MHKVESMISSLFVIVSWRNVSWVIIDFIEI